MKGSDIITQIGIELPRHTDLFSTELTISSMTFSGGTVTIVTSTNHGLNSGALVVVNNALSPNSITTLSSLDGIATAITTNDHDLTGLVRNDPNTTVNITGAADSEYNGDKKLLSVPNRKTFTYEIDSAAPASTTGGVLNENLGIGYNGPHNITVTNPTTFTYPSPITLGSPATGIPQLLVGTQVSGAVNIESAVQSYTKQLQDKLWAFVVLDDSPVSKDPNTKNDSDFTGGPGTDPRQKIIQNFSVYVFIRSKDDVAGRESRDLIEDVRPFLLRSLLRFKPPSTLAECPDYGISYSGDSLFIYAESYLVHRFQFQNLVDITIDDTFKSSNTRSFRNMHFDFIDPIVDDSDNVIMTLDIDLDEEPL